MLAALVSSAAMLRAADIRQGLVSYWPLDTVSADTFTSPDLVSGNDLNVAWIDNSTLVSGQEGQAFSFDGASQYAWFTTPPEVDTGLPVSQHPQFTVTFWANGVGTGQNDRRMYSESSSLNTDPLFNLGTHNARTDDTVDIYIRNNGVHVNHAHSSNPGIDGEWHHIAWTETNGMGALYIDGEFDSAYNYTPGSTPLDTVSIGAIVRDEGFSLAAFFAGSMDEVAVWERGLTQAEIQEVMNNGIETPVPDFAPVITQQPEGDTELVQGKTITLMSAAAGSRPLSYQWQKDGVAISGATSRSLELSDLQLDDSGEYALIVQNASGSATSTVAQITVNPPPPADLSRGLVSHWPLDEIEGTKTPDVISGYDMTLVNLAEADLVEGRIGQAFNFQGSEGTLLERVHTASEDLPANKHPEFAVAMWAMVDGLGQNDLRLFSEGNTGNSTPLFNIGTHNTGGGPEADFFIRQTGWTAVDHAKSVGGPFDGTWHHIVFVQEEDGSRSFYIDGELDPVEMAAKPVGQFLEADNTTIGGILRSSRTHFVTGLIDEVAIWKRALTSEEVGQLFSEGVPSGGPVTQPLAIRSFTADYPTVVEDQEVTLRGK